MIDVRGILGSEATLNALSSFLTDRVSMRFAMDLALEPEKERNFIERIVFQLCDTHVLALVKGFVEGMSGTMATLAETVVEKASDLLDFCGQAKVAVEEFVNNPKRFLCRVTAQKIWDNLSPDQQKQMHEISCEKFGAIVSATTPAAAPAAVPATGAGATPAVIRPVLRDVFPTPLARALYGRQGGV